jgi:hypothetical protein
MIWSATLLVGRPLRVSAVLQSRSLRQNQFTRGARLVVQLQGELNLSRIVWRITSRINLAKIRTLEIERAWGGSPVAPAGKSRGVEVWMIENVEEFPAELQTEAVGKREVLEKREVQPSEVRPGNLGGAAAQSGNAGQGNTS